MRAAARSSAQILGELWKTFQSRHGGEQGGSPPSMRQVSHLWLGLDPQSLAHWTSEAGHAKHPAWRIPLKRIPEVCHVLDATPAGQDALMWARLQESEAYDKGVDVLVVLDWLAPTIAQLATQPSSDALELEVLAAFRRVRARHPLTEGGVSDLGFAPLLETGFENWLTPALNAYVDDRIADSEEESTVDLAAAKEKVLQKLDAFHRTRSVAAPKVSVRERQDSVRRLRRALRASQAGVIGNAEAVAAT